MTKNDRSKKVSLAMKKYWANRRKHLAKLKKADAFLKQGRPDKQDFTVHFPDGKKEHYPNAEAAVSSLVNIVGMMNDAVKKEQEKVSNLTAQANHKPFIAAYETIDQLKKRVKDEQETINYLRAELKQQWEEVDTKDVVITTLAERVATLNAKLSDAEDALTKKAGNREWLPALGCFTDELGQGKAKYVPHSHAGETPAVEWDLNPRTGESKVVRGANYLQEGSAQMAREIKADVKKYNRKDKDEESVLNKGWNTER